MLSARFELPTLMLMSTIVEHCTITQILSDNCIFLVCIIYFVDYNNILGKKFKHVMVEFKKKKKEICIVY